jgi:hypothetical protein
MQWFITKESEYRPQKWPCCEVYLKSVRYFLFIPIKTTLTKLK